MTRKKPDLSEGDDGHTIVNMNVEGMPWYKPESGTRLPHAERKHPQEHAEQVLTKEEGRYYTWGSLKAALLVVGVLSAGLVLFVLICQFVWFR